MGGKRVNLDTVHFRELVGVLRESDDVGVLLRGHLWIEALLEYAARGKLESPDAIGWGGARFEHKLALAEAVGVLDHDMAVAVRGFNGLRNRLAHELVFQVTDAEVTTLIGRLGEEHRAHIRGFVDQQLEIYVEVERAKSVGMEIEFDPELEWYPRVMTPTRANLYAFVIYVARTLAFEGAFGAIDRKGIDDPTEFLAVLDAEVERLTGGLFRFNRSRE
ncbi:hypothetical protein HDC37_000801 [Microbacterium sp. AK009]|uniref:hypothetical protein n=1 Tax=Microbacterium sp. AK009 TaxID=2723068 RepID=UPI0015CE8D42|nr:hypothetical protein [Microbacterium sp. AK009]NYF15987.1 hypothetical protein [Microbacterium sp. AK009]